MKDSTASRSSSYPVKVKSSPCTTHCTSSFGRKKQQALALPLANPKPSSVSVYNASQRAGAARVPYRLRRSLAHIPGWDTSGGRATYMSSST
eukprot:7857798-Alexandrium_andersonii.AAC.1